MNRAMLAHVICPDCKGDLEQVTPFADGNDILAGGLYCKPCDMTYEIADGIPNFLPRAFRTKEHRFDETFGETPPDRSLAGIGKGACKELSLCQDIGRSEWVKVHASGRVLDVGSNEASGWTVALPIGTVIKPGRITLKDGRQVACDLPAVIKDITLFDCDLWVAAFPSFRGDAHHLPFRDGTFDTVVLSDILEHVEDDYAVLAEAVRVAKRQVIGTTPDEYGWDPSLMPFKPIQEWIEEKGGDYDALIESETTGLRTDYATCKDFISDRDLIHLHHVRWYDGAKVRKLLESVGKPFELSHIHYHGTPAKFTNFAFTLKV